MVTAFARQLRCHRVLRRLTLLHSGQLGDFVDRVGWAVAISSATSKLVKWIKGIEFVADFHDIGSGYGGYSEDHKYFGRHQTL